MGSMSNRSFSVAILVSTYNWPQALEIILMSILQQTQLPDEVLIADDGSGEETQLLINKYRKLFNIPVKHAWHEDMGFRKSLILNKAVKLSNVDYIIEIDGDIILHSKFIEDHIKHAREGNFVQGARTMISEEITGEILRKRQQRMSFFSKGIRNRFNSIRFPALSFVVKTNSRSSNNIKGCNLAFWRKDFIAINGYNNLFQGWGSEDNEFAARLINAGVLKQRLKLAAICYHLHHKCNSTSQFAINERRYTETIENNIVFCPNGYAEV